ncbi:MAG: YggS family pyridoxal phosphate-dependent enzyme [Ruminococcaceae bacterium]|nr:YggS family pyridoxal phosphate-dependent enzyme [Oscillospiraceae bacterium]
MTTAEKLDIIKEEISDCAKKSGRCSEDIMLLPVTKTKTVEEIMPALEYGIKAIGENYVQELVAKYDILCPYVEEFHMIGHLQSNKVKYLVDKVSLIHSVESHSVLYEIQKQMKKRDKIQDILLEVNLTKEDSKFGIYEEHLEEFYQKAKECANVRVRGLMTMPPVDYQEAQLRGVFSKMRQIFERYNDQDSACDILSMGMSNDYTIAIEEGSTLVRIGSKIFGPRVYQ